MIVHFQAHRQKIGACAPIVAKRVPLLAEFALESNCGAKDESLGELEQNPAFCTGSQLCVIDTPVECAAVKKPLSTVVQSFHSAGHSTPFYTTHSVNSAGTRCRCPMRPLVSHTLLACA